MSSTEVARLIEAGLKRRPKGMNPLQDLKLIVSASLAALAAFTLAACAR
jgi:hypothetical protein